MDSQPRHSLKNWLVNYAYGDVGSYTISNHHQHPTNPQSSRNHRKMVPGKSLVGSPAAGDSYIHVIYIYKFAMSVIFYKPTYSISFDDLDIEVYPFRVIISMLEGKRGVLKITEKFKDSQATRTFNAKQIGFGFPVNPSGPIRILDRSTGTMLYELKPMYCTCVKEITKVRSLLDDETKYTSKYVFTQVDHRVNNADQYKFKSYVIFTPDAES